MSIQYLRLRTGEAAVFVDGKMSGHIRKCDGGYRYEPKGGGHHGETFKTERDVKASLEGEV